MTHLRPLSALEAELGFCAVLRGRGGCPVRDGTLECRLSGWSMFIIPFTCDGQPEGPESGESFGTGTVDLCGGAGKEIMCSTQISQLSGRDL